MLPWWIACMLRSFLPVDSSHYRGLHLFYICLQSDVMRWSFAPYMIIQLPDCNIFLLAYPVGENPLSFVEPWKQ
jgi:hypothetical protein